MVESSLNGLKMPWKKEKLIIIFRNEQFLLFPQIFPQSCTVEIQKQGLIWERVKNTNCAILLKFCLYEKPFENIVEKGENAGNPYFFLFHSVFYPSHYKFQFFSHIYFVVCKCFQFGPV